MGELSASVSLWFGSSFSPAFVIASKVISHTLPSMVSLESSKLFQELLPDELCGLKKVVQEQQFAATPEICQLFKERS
jgi:hypothetical protein